MPSPPRPPARPPQICGTNYTQDLLQWVDAENLPDWLGGKSKARHTPPQRRPSRRGRWQFGVAGCGQCWRRRQPFLTPPSRAPAPQGTLLDDVGPWSDPEVLQRLQPSLPAAGRALKALRVSASSGAGALITAVGDGDAEEIGDGYASPK